MFDSSQHRLVIDDLRILEPAGGIPPKWLIEPRGWSQTRKKARRRDGKESNTVTPTSLCPELHVRAEGGIDTSINVGHRSTPCKSILREGAHSEAANRNGERRVFNASNNPQFEELDTRSSNAPATPCPNSSHGLTPI